MDDNVVGGYIPPEDPSLLPDIPRGGFFTRRKFLALGGGTAAGLGFGWNTEAAHGITIGDYVGSLGGLISGLVTGLFASIFPNYAGLANFGRTMTINMLRREDMLRLRFELYNLVASGSDPNKLVKNNSGKPAYIVVTFPPQHLAEEALLRLDGGTGHTPKPEDAPRSSFDGPNENFANDKLARTRLAGASRLVFEVPASALPIARSQDGLLDWLKFTARLAPGARTSNDAGGPSLAAPKGNDSTDAGETALELPWRLQISPLPNGGWLHARTLPAPSPSNGYSLWHTRLGARTVPFPFIGPPIVDETLPRAIRALWNTDKNWTPLARVADTDAHDDDDPAFLSQSNNNPPGDYDGDGQVFEPFRTSLSPRNRQQIVRNSAGFTMQTSSAKVRPVDVNRLMLSPLGGFLDVEGKWDEPITDMLLWRHRATLGRDQFVEVIERGFFLPWGFPAVRIKITERVVEQRTFNGYPTGTLNVAFLRQRIHYVIRNPVVDYPSLSHDSSKPGLELPFVRIRAKTLVTPDVADDLGLMTGYIVPSLDGSSPEGAFRFDLEATDHEGRTIALRQPMAFAYESRVTGDAPNDANQAVNTFNVAHPVLRSQILNGQKVAFARADRPADTAYETNTMLIKLRTAKAVFGPHQPLFAPVLESANVRVDAADTFVGKANGGVDVGYADFFLDEEFGTGNGSNTFLLLKDAKEIAFESSEGAGGVASPSFKLTGLSRSKGAIGGSHDNLKDGTFDPADWFPTSLPSAKMIGLDLLDIVANGAMGQSMTLSTTEVANGIQSVLRWNPTLKADPLGILLNPDDATFSLNATVVRKDDGTTTHDVRGELRNATLRLLGSSLEFLHIDVKRMIFTSRTGTSPDLDVRLGELKFVGALSFVNELREVLANTDGPFGIEVDGSGISARGGISLPALTVGIFSLKNLAFSLEVVVPFDARPAAARFNISSKKDPFLVAVSIFGGGGWFSLTVDTTGLQAIEAGFEFGGVLAMDFGVAGGSLEVMVGIYFRLEKVPIGSGQNAHEENKVTLTGYVRVHGEVHVGFVSLGMTAELDLTYVEKKKQGKTYRIVTGRCEVTLEVPAAPDVSFEIEKSFGGDPHDPRFVDQVTLDEWLQYVDAFKEEEDAA